MIFIFFIYLPSSNRVAQIKKELSTVESQISEIEATISQSKSMDEGISLLRERFRELNNKFPPKEQEAIKAISGLARKLNIEIISIRPQPKKDFFDENNNNVEIDGKTCQSIFVSIEMSCFYKDLVRYIHSLKEDLPAFVSIQNLLVNKSGTSKLNVILDINLYLLS